MSHKLGGLLTTTIISGREGRRSMMYNFGTANGRVWLAHRPFAALGERVFRIPVDIVIAGTSVHLSVCREGTFSCDSCRSLGDTSKSHGQAKSNIRGARILGYAKTLPGLVLQHSIHTDIWK